MEALSGAVSPRRERLCGRLCDTTAGLLGAGGGVGAGAGLPWRGRTHGVLTRGGAAAAVAGGGGGGSGSGGGAGGGGGSGR